MQFQFIHSIEDIPQKNWDLWRQNQDPFCQPAFLSALESSGCVGPSTGWTSTHLLAYQDDLPMGMLPLYNKSHSYGEYVFDFAWADAYRQHQLAYYPKLVNAIPYTPVTGPRLFCHPDIQPDVLLAQMLDYLTEQLPKMAMSSLHLLFLSSSTSQLLQQRNIVQRKSVQFEWHNRQYNDFAHYLSQFTARRRKMVRKERAKIEQQGLTVTRLVGSQISAEQMDFFYQCYRQTYLKRSGHEGYLNREFFDLLLDNMSQNLMLTLAHHENQAVAGALFVFNQEQLCGRYWGSLQEFDALHFECCYYQGIEFCIEKGIARFNPGTQGEHKILRGFEPTFCYSNHYLVEPAFHAAVVNFVQQESESIERYHANAQQLLPFRRSD